MVEVWLKYGRTEIFADFGIGEKLRVLEPQVNKADLSSQIEHAAAMISDTDRLQVIVDYVAGVEGFPQLVHSLVSKLVDNKLNPRNVEVTVTAWRYNAPQLENIFTTEIAQEIRRLGVAQVSSLGEGSPSDGFILISPTIYWGGEIISPSRLVHLMGFSEPAGVLSPAVGWGGVIADLFFGYLSEVERKAVEVVEKSSKLSIGPDFDILVLGGPGYPTDHYLSTSIHLAASLGDELEGLAVIIPLECSGGLGAKGFVEALTGKIGEDGTAYARLVEIWRIRAMRNKICLVTALPSTIVERLLNAKQSDTLDMALTYARRLKTREASIAVVRNSLGAMISLEQPRDRDEGENQHRQNP